MNTPETVQSVQDRLRVKRLLLIERWVDEEIAKPRTKVIYFEGEDGKLTPEGEPSPSYATADGFKALDWLGASLLRRVQALEELSRKVADGEALGKVMYRVQALEEQAKELISNANHQGENIVGRARKEDLQKIEYRLLALETALQIQQVVYKVEPQPWPPKPVEPGRLSWQIDSQYLVLDGQHMIPWDVVDAMRAERDAAMTHYAKEREAARAWREQGHDPAVLKRAREERG